MHVAIAACRSSPEADDEDVYEDDDHDVLVEALAAEDASADVVVWDHRTVDWSRFDAVVLRSTWDAVDRPDELRRWVERVDAVTTVLNPRAAIEWNLDKAYLRLGGGEHHDAVLCSPVVVTPSR
jgi:hypothetical protein